MRSYALLSFGRMAGCELSDDGLARYAATRVHLAARVELRGLGPGVYRVDEAEKYFMIIEISS